METGNRFPFAQTKFEEREGQFSPDGKWIAYQSNESGPFDIYVQPFPGPGGNICGGVSHKGYLFLNYRRRVEPRCLYEQPARIWE